MFEGFAVEVKPDADAFIRLVTGAGNPKRVHFVELFLDLTVEADVAKRFGLADGLDPSAPFYELARRTRVQEFLGYDFVYEYHLDGLNFPRELVGYTDDTAPPEVSRGQRGWVNEQKGPVTTWREFEEYPWPEPGKVDEAASDQVARRLLGNADRVAGGFGAAPKFVIPALIEYASLRRARQRPDLYEHALFTVGQIIDGPLYDRRGGGVHRMAARPMWKGIQYEKLLTVNTALVRDLTYALREQPGHPTLTRALEQTCAFVVRVLSRPEGGFYLAQAADGTSDDGGGYWRGDSAEGEPPPVDRLVLSGPNALAGAALVRAGLTLGNDRLVSAGRGALDLVVAEGYSPGRGVRHVLEPNPGDRLYLTAQADAALGLLDGYETLGNPRYLELARDIVETAWLNLKHEGEALLRDYIPGPTPIGLLARPRHPLRPNLRIARALIRLDLHGAGTIYRERAGSILEAVSGDLGRYGMLASELVLAVEEFIRGPLVIRLPAGDDPTALSLRRAAAISTWPWSVSVTRKDTTAMGAELVWRDRSLAVATAEELPAAIVAVTGAE